MTSIVVEIPQALHEKIVELVENTPGISQDDVVKEALDWYFFQQKDKRND